jgi:hypothetical protein
MQWYNDPARVEETQNRVTVTTKPQHDFWRETRHGFIKDDGHFYYREVSGDFTAEVKFTGAYKDQYDQAGLMLRADEFVWLKCGVELLNDVQQASTVVTRDYSDWSVVALPNTPESMWLRVVRLAEAVEVYYSLNGASYTLMRQAYLTKQETLQVGLMCCSPKGDGFTVTFEDFTITDAPLRRG